jgi:hypothetical protein
MSTASRLQSVTFETHPEMPAREATLVWLLQSRICLPAMSLDLVHTVRPHKTIASGETFSLNVRLSIDVYYLLVLENKPEKKNKGGAK